MELEIMAYLTLVHTGKVFLAEYESHLGTVLNIYLFTY